MKTCIVELFLVVLFGCFFLTACSISFSNISTHGNAADVSDTTQTPTTDVKADVSVPVSPI